MDLEKLKSFLINANQAGYASGDEKKQVKETDGSTTITFGKDDFSMHDNYFGGEPYGGREVVSYKGKAVWMMVYYGWVESSVVDIGSVYTILQGALRNMPEEAPFRGPSIFKEGEYEYRNSWKGEVSSFSGVEEIYQGEKQIYKATYIGGLVDQRVE